MHQLLQPFGLALLINILSNEDDMDIRNTDRILIILDDKVVVI